jgi:hypothetical protein
MRTRIAAVAAVLAMTGCAGDDSKQKRAEAAEWCRITAGFESAFDQRTFRARGLSGPGSSQIPWDRAAEWVDVAPREIRASTERAALILRELPTDPPHPDLKQARVEIADYAQDNCPKPVACIGDVEGNPRFPCIH